MLTIDDAHYRLKPILAQRRLEPAFTEQSFRSGEYPSTRMITRKFEESHQHDLQVKLLKLQKWVKETDQRMIMLSEDRDAAGKVGTIKRFMEHMNRRSKRSSARKAF